jgi:hypothetical protein
MASSSAAVVVILDVVVLILVVVLLLVVVLVVVVVVVVDRNDDSAAWKEEEERARDGGGRCGTTSRANATPDVVFDAIDDPDVAFVVDGTTMPSGGEEIAARSATTRTTRRRLG